MKRHVPNYDLAFLNGLDVQQICIGSHQHVINLSGNVAISIECDFEAGGCRNDLSQLIRFVGQVIRQGRLDEDGHISIAFGNQSSLTVYNSNEDHESYQITTPESTIVV